MNIPGITRALELDDADWDLAVKLRGLTEHQREQFSAALVPVKSSKKSSKKSAGGGGRSKRGESLKQQISTSGVRQSSTITTADDIFDDTDRCHFTRADGNPCKLLPDHNIHHMMTANEYHEFQPAVTSAAGSGG